MDHFVCFREQLLHKLKLEEKEHEEKLSRERAAKVAELHVSAAVLYRKVTFFCFIRLGHFMIARVCNMQYAHSSMTL